MPGLSDTPGIPAVQVHHAASAQAAIELIQSQVPDLVVIDGQLFGSDLLDQLRASGCKAPVLVRLENPEAEETTFLHAGASGIWHAWAESDDSLPNALRLVAQIKDAVMQSRRWEDERTSWYQAITRHFPNGSVYVIDPEGHILLVDGQGLAQIGISPEQITGKTIDQVFGQDAAFAQLKAAQQRSLQGESVYLQVEFRGRVREVRVEPVREPDGQIKVVTVMTQDVTDRNRAEAALRRSETSLAQAQRVAHLGSIQIDPQTRLETWSDEAYHVLGYAPQCLEQHDRHFLPAVHPEDRDLVQQRVTALRDRCEAFSLEHRIIRPNGEVRWVQHDAEASLSESGEVINCVHTLLDVTERHEIEDELNHFFSLSVEMFCIVDKEGRFREVNSAWERTLGYARSELLGRHFVDFVHPDDMVATRLEAEGVFAGARSSNFQNRYRCKNGSYKWISWSSTPDVANGVVYAVASDITERRLNELRLRESVAQKSAMLESALDAIISMDAEGRILEFNPAAESIFGYKREAVLGKDLADLIIPPDLRERHRNGLKHFQDSGDGPLLNRRVEFQALRADSTQFPAEIGITAVGDRDSRTFTGFIRDITERTQAEEALFASRARLQEAYDDMERRVRERTAELEQTNQNLHAEVVERQNAVGALRETVLQLERATQETEQINNELRRNEARLMEGNRVFAELTQLRVTSESELQATLQRTTEASAELLDVERCSIWVLSDAEDAIICLDLFERATGQHSAGLVLNELDFPNYFQALKTQRTIVAQDAHTHPATAEFSASYLTPLNIESMMDTAIIAGGERIGVLCCEQIGKQRDWQPEDEIFAGSAAAICSLAIEACERSKTDQALRSAIFEAEAAREAAVSAQREAELANAAKSDFLSRMSHELRTPMNSILGFAQILQMQAPEGKQAQRVTHILKAGRHLLQLIDEVLDLAKVESGRMGMSPEPVALADTIQSAMDLVRPLCDQQEIRLYDNSQACTELFAMADRQRLSQILLNLLSNATKYNRRGGEIQVSCQVLDAQTLRISVIDTGIGIPSQYLERAFNPFERLGAETTSIEGTGLGLALTKRLVEAMGGQIGVSSEIGKGSQFWVDLPRVSAPRVNRMELPDTSQPPLVEGENTILYIEDNLANLQVIEEVLESQPNIHLISAMQGQIGLDFARRHQPALILLDLHLPDLPGEEVLRRLRADPLCEHIPVIVISADATPNQVRRLRDAGADEYLTKPLDVRQFVNVIQSVLRNKEKVDELV